MGSMAPTFQVVDNPHSFVNSSVYRVSHIDLLALLPQHDVASDCYSKQISFLVFLWYIIGAVVAFNFLCLVTPNLSSFPSASIFHLFSNCT